MHFQIPPKTAGSRK